MTDDIDLYDHLRPGLLIGGRYRYVAPVAHGRVGLLLRVRDERGRDLALKTIRPKARRESTAERLAATEATLRHEFEVMDAVHHPNIVAAHGWIRDARLGWCTVMEYAGGGTLRARLRQRQLGQDEALDLFAQVMDAVAALHGPCPAFPGGVAHLDLEPKNIVFAADGTPKLCDLHYARPLAPSAGAIALPSDAVGGIDARTDVRQLGRLLWEMLTFLPPEQLAPEMLPASLATFVATMVADDAEDRDQTMAEARRAYEAARGALGPTGAAGADPGSAGEK